MIDDLDVARRLVQYHDHISPPRFAIADDLRRGRHRVRRNRGVVAGGVALGLASVVAGVMSLPGVREVERVQPAGPAMLVTPLVAPRSLLDIRQVGFRVQPGPGRYVTDDVGLDRDLQRTSVLVGGLELGVAVYYRERFPGLPSSGTRDDVTVHGAPGTYIEEAGPDYWSARLAWEYAPDSWAEVSGRWSTAPPPDLRSKLVAVAEAVRSGGNTVRVPVRLGTVPGSLPPITAAHSLDVSSDGGEWMWRLSIDDISIWATSRPVGECLGSEGRPPTEEFTYRGHSGCVVAGERIGLRLGPADVFVDYGPSPDLPIEDMKRLLAELTVASDDRETWFDLNTALGG